MLCSNNEGGQQNLTLTLNNTIHGNKTQNLIASIISTRLAKIMSIFSSHTQGIFWTLTATFSINSRPQRSDLKPGQFGDPSHTI